MPTDALCKGRREIKRRASLDGANGSIDELLPGLFVADDVYDGWQRTPEETAVASEAKLHRDE